MNDPKLQALLDQMRDLFEKHDISEVWVHYEGGGDSGSFTANKAILFDGSVCSIADGEFQDEADEDMKELDITLKDQAYTKQDFDQRTQAWVDTPAKRDISFADFVVEVAEAFVDLNHGGWENNEGGYGNVIIRMENTGVGALAEAVRRRVTVVNDHADYIQTVEESSHEWVSDVSS